MAFPPDEILGIPWENIKIGLIILAILGFLAVWQIWIRVWLQDRFIKYLRKFTKKPRKKILAVKWMFHILFLLFAIIFAAVLVSILDLWNNDAVEKGGGIIAGIAILIAYLAQTHFASGFLSGIEVLLLAAFDDGDWVRMKSKFGEISYGKVLEVGTHGTLLRGDDLVPFTVPNHEVLKMIEIKNYSRAVWHYERILIPVPDDSDAKTEADRVLSQVNINSIATELENDSAAQSFYEKDFGTVTATQWHSLVFPGVDFDVEHPKAIWLRVPVRDREEAKLIRHTIYMNLYGGTA
jgi:small-conductance mechanosensitive channel